RESKNPYWNILQNSKTNLRGANEMSDAQPSFLLSRGCQRTTVAISPPSQGVSINAVQTFNQ
ncbi:MAG TPA: hypothetical protein PK862_02825, partial [Candidatus Pacearchaeota archaeon]|nr:hypothetical protein [Candidatus Pacearchaeota archaeon]